MSLKSVPELPKPQKRPAIALLPTTRPVFVLPVSLSHARSGASSVSTRAMTKALAMNSSSRAGPSGQTMQLYLYRRAIHPDLFQLRVRKTIPHGKYELEAWLMDGAHLLRFRHGPFTCCEVLTDGDTRLPLEGAVTCIPCAGEHEFEHTFHAEKVTFCTAVQTETLSSNLYKATYEDMLDYARETNSTAHKYNDADGRKCLSVLDLHHLSKEVHCQGFHLLAATGMVVRTQTIFSHA